MKCNICNNSMTRCFDAKVLGKYEVSYYRCGECSFLQVEEPYWLEEAYGSGAISALDTGILSRNTLLSGKTSDLLGNIFKNKSDFSGLDYGGGEGIFVRMMRDLGYNFFLQDKYATNLYAKFFDLKNLNQDYKFDILTAFEVFEHLPKPLVEMDKMFKYSDVILFSTELIPNRPSERLRDWWYIVPETGQHVSFYHLKTLKFIAEKIGVYLYTNGHNLHIYSKEELNDNPFDTESGNFLKRLKGFFSRKITEERASLIQSDFEYVKSRLKRESRNNLH